MQLRALSSSRHSLAVGQRAKVSLNSSLGARTLLCHSTSTKAGTEQAGRSLEAVLLDVGIEESVMCSVKQHAQHWPSCTGLAQPHWGAATPRQCPHTSASFTAHAASPAGDASSSQAGPSSSSSNSSSSSSSSTSSDSSQAGDPPLGLLQRWQRDSRRMQEQLKALGAAGVIAYGLFNTLYYTVAFVFVWFSLANVPSGLGVSGAARKAAEVFALVWAGSQVTKLLRAGAALACAPLIDKGLEALGLQDKRKAYLLIVLGCVVLASAVIGVVVLLHA